jgi:hypothetical protein
MEVPEKPFNAVRSSARNSNLPILRIPAFSGMLAGDSLKTHFHSSPTPRAWLGGGVVCVLFPPSPCPLPSREGRFEIVSKEGVLRESHRCAAAALHIKTL